MKCQKFGFKFSPKSSKGVKLCVCVCVRQIEKIYKHIMPAWKKLFDENQL